MLPYHKLSVIERLVISEPLASWYGSRAIFIAPIKDWLVSRLISFSKTPWF